MTREEAFAAWKARLKSNVDKQIKGRLTDGIGYCPLGILCDILKDQLNLKVEKDPDFQVALPKEVYRFMDITPWGALADSGVTITDLNDSGDYTFPEIAEYIEPDKLRKTGGDHILWKMA